MKKIDAVVPSVTLNRLVENWNARGGIGAKAPEKSSAAWLKLCKFVRDSKVTREQLHYALIKIRGMKESSAKVVTSRLLRLRTPEAGAMLDRALAGDLTTYDLRVGASKGNAKGIVKAKLRGAARNALEESMKYDTFISQAGEAYAKARILAKTREAREKTVIVTDDADALLPAT